jgi:hypothetical protein
MPHLFTSRRTVRRGRRDRGRRDLLVVRHRAAEDHCVSADASPLDALVEARQPE